MVPRFTIRTILAVMAFCAVLFLLVGSGYRGQTWAWGAVIGVLSLGVTVLVHAACFGIVWCFARLSARAAHDFDGKPVASDASVARGVYWLAVLAAAANAHPAAAQITSLTSVSNQTNGFVVEVPGKNLVSRRSGLRLEVDSRWPNNYGYRPVRVRVRALKPTTAAHQITLRLYVSSWEWRSGRVAVEQDFEMPLGATLAETVVACPQYQSGHRYWWDVRVDGVLDKDLSVAEAAGWQLTAAGAANSTNTALKFLIIGTPAESQQIVGAGSDIFESLVLSIADLPTRWIDYSAIDAIALSPNDLGALAKTKPEALEAIRRWNLAGGQLWISPVGDQWQRLAEVEELLMLSASPHVAEVTESELDAAIAARGWQPIKLGKRSTRRVRVTFIHAPTGRTHVVRDPTIIAQLKSDSDYIVTDDSTLTATGETTSGESSLLTKSNREKTPTDSAKWYIQRPTGLGYVRVFREAWDPTGFAISWQMLQGTSDFDSAATKPLTTPLTAAMETTRTWESRHGMTPDTANSDFAKLLVPGVGEAPVTEFRVLITVFVLVIGPLNYWLLQRTNRLYLLLVTVPAVAAALTAGLFVYAFLSDGLATTARVRSFTTLDQHSGEAVCWARISYYAGLGPGRGLTLPDDIALYPIIPGWNEANNGAFLGAERQMEWIDSEQRLAEGWLRSRTPTQYLSVRARKSPHRLRLTPSGEQLTVQNGLGTRIVFVAVVDDKGQIFSREAIADQATAELNATTRADVQRRMRQLVADNEPAAPPALVDEVAGFSRMQRRQRRRMFRTQYGLDYGLERLGDNLQSDAIAALVGSNDQPLVELPPRSYVAVTDAGPEVVLGVPIVEEEASFHVVVGSW